MIQGQHSWALGSYMLKERLKQLRFALQDVYSYDQEPQLFGVPVAGENPEALLNPLQSLLNTNSIVGGTNTVFTRKPFT